MTATEVKTVATTETKVAEPVVEQKTETKPVEKTETKPTPALGEEKPDPVLGTETEPEAETDAEPETKEEEKPPEYDFKPPEGREYRPKVIDGYKEVATKHKVAPDVAKDILDSMLTVLDADVADQLKEADSQAEARDQEELRKRHGDKLESVVALANRALHKLASPKLREAIANSPRLRRNPDFTDFLANVGGRVTNDKSIRSTNAPDAKPQEPLAQIAAEYDEMDKQIMRGN